MTQDSAGHPSVDDGDQLREIREAQDACEAALTSLGETQRRVDSARSWGTYDTWFGGGLLSSLVKHDRIDEAESYMHAVDEALDRLRRELADVHMGGAAIGGVGVTDLTRTLDVWFDNFFSDLAVQSRLKDADHRAGRHRRGTRRRTPCPPRAVHGDLLGGRWGLSSDSAPRPLRAGLALKT